MAMGHAKTWLGARAPIPPHRVYAHACSFECTKIVKVVWLHPSPFEYPTTGRWSLKVWQFLQLPLYIAKRWIGFKGLWGAKAEIEGQGYTATHYPPIQEGQWRQHLFLQLLLHSRTLYMFTPLWNQQGLFPGKWLCHKIATTVFKKRRLVIFTMLLHAFSKSL